MLRTYDGRGFSLSELRALRGPWARQYEHVIATHAAREFLVSYESVCVRKTFAEFDSDVRRVLALLRGKFDSCDTVVLAAENSYAMAVFQMAVLLSGKSLCPLNPREGHERIRQKVRQLACECAVFSVLSEFEPLAIPESGPEWRGNFAELPLSRVAVQIFTSGSTGYSKIVEQTEANLLANVDALLEHHRLGPESVIATPLPLFHVNAFAFALLCSFAAGGKLVLLASSDPDGIFAAVERERATILSAIPSVLSILILRAKGRGLESLRYVVSAAAPLSVSLAKSFYSAFGVRIVQGYGLSEAVNFSLTMPADLNEEDYACWMWGGEFPSVGVELRGNTVQIRDAQGAECGPECEGELAIQGWNVTRGYMGAAFAGEWLATGDLGYYRVDPVTGRKFFFISGRKKEIAKRFGETVSLREIDDMVQSFSFDGLDAIAVAFANDLAGEELGLVCHTEGKVIDADWKARLREKIEKEIPAPLRPRVLLEVETPLRTASGKATRWAFQNLFAPYKATALGAHPHWNENA